MNWAQLAKEIVILIALVFAWAVFCSVGAKFETAAVNIYELQQETNRKLDILLEQER